MPKEIRTCPDCGGSGTASVLFKCSGCNGKRKVWVDTNTGRVLGPAN
jgi:RecJ-like exonuclease